MLEESFFNTFRNIGQDIFLTGLVGSHVGNMSVRSGDRIHITRRAAMLGHLKPEDIIEVDFKKSDYSLLTASSEVLVHKAIYLNTSALAIIYAHPLYATLLSMIEDELVPLDWEGSHVLKKVPVMTLEEPIGSEKAARIVSEYLKNHKIILLRGHGSFARGDMLEEAFMLTSSLESSAFFLYHLKGTGKDIQKETDLLQ